MSTIQSFAQFDLNNNDLFRLLQGVDPSVIQSSYGGSYMNYLYSLTGGQRGFQPSRGFIANDTQTFTDIVNPNIWKLITDPANQQKITVKAFMKHIAIAIQYWAEGLNIPVDESTIDTLIKTINERGLPDFLREG
jgi:hypothetical protein